MYALLDNMKAANRYRAEDGIQLLPGWKHPIHNPTNTHLPKHNVVMSRILILSNALSASPYNGFGLNSNAASILIREQYRQLWMRLRSSSDCYRLVKSLSYPNKACHSPVLLHWTLGRTLGSINANFWWWCISMRIVSAYSIWRYPMLEAPSRGVVSDTGLMNLI